MWNGETLAMNDIMCIGNTLYMHTNSECKASVHWNGIIRLDYYTLDKDNNTTAQQCKVSL